MRHEMCTVMCKIDRCSSNCKLRAWNLGRKGHRVRVLFGEKKDMAASCLCVRARACYVEGRRLSDRYEKAMIVRFCDKDDTCQAVF